MRVRTGRNGMQEDRSEAVDGETKAAVAGARSRLPRRVGSLVAAGLAFAALAWALLWRVERLYVSSDSVAQQSIVLTWLHAGHGTTFLPSDTWLLKIPFYLLIEPLPLPAGGRLLLEALVLGGAGVVLCVLAVRWLTTWRGQARWWSDAALPLAWVSLLGGGLGQYLSVMPNSRNVELGLSFLALALADRYLEPDRYLESDRILEPDRGLDAAGVPWSRPTWRGIASAAAATLALGLLWVDDPYFAYLVGAPLVGASVVWYLLRSRDRRLLGLALLVSASLLLIPLLRTLLALVGVVVVPNGTGITRSLAELLDHLPILGPALAGQVGLQDHGAVTAVGHGLTVLVLVTGFLLSGYLVWTGWRTRRLVLTFLGGHWLVVALGVVANRTVYDFHAGRYLVLAVYDLAVVIGVGLVLVRPRWPRLAAAVTGLLVLAVTTNAIAVAVDRPHPPALMAEQSAVLGTVQDAGLRKGYAEFWAADLFTHRSGGSVLVSEVSCAAGRLRRRHWLTDTGRSRADAPRTFFLWDPAANGLRGCTLGGVESQLGTPAIRLPGPGGIVTLVYDGDLGERIPSPVLPRS